MLSTFEIFGRARNHGKKFPKLSQTSFSGIVYSNSKRFYVQVRKEKYEKSASNVNKKIMIMVCEVHLKLHI